MDSYVAFMLNPAWGWVGLIFWIMFCVFIGGLLSAILLNAFRKYVLRSHLSINNTPWKCTT